MEITKFGGDIKLIDIYSLYFLSQIDKIPQEILQKILIKLDFRDLINTLYTNRYFFTITKDENFWKLRYKRDMVKEKIYPEKSWFENYKMYYYQICYLCVC